jgi:hypothetical protein
MATRIFGYEVIPTQSECTIVLVHGFQASSVWAKTCWGEKARRT